MDFVEHVKVREEKFGTVIFDTLKEKVFVTNQTGKDVLTCLQEGKNTEEIIKSLTDKYNENGLDIEDDVVDFLEALLKNGLLKKGDFHGTR